MANFAPLISELMTHLQHSEGKEISYINTTHFVLVKERMKDTIYLRG